MGATAQLFQTLEEVLEIFEDNLLEEPCTDLQKTVTNRQDFSGWTLKQVVSPKYAHEFSAPEGLQKVHWTTVKGYCSELINLADGEQLCAFGDPVDGMWLLLSGMVAVETMGAEKDQRVPKISAKYSAPFTI